MRDFIAKIVAAGLIDSQTAKLFELWKALPGVEELARQVEEMRKSGKVLRISLEDLSPVPPGGDFPRESVVDPPSDFPLTVDVCREGRKSWQLPAALFGGSVMVKYTTTEEIPRYGDLFCGGKVVLTTLVGDQLAIVETRRPDVWA